MWTKVASGPIEILRSTAVQKIGFRKQRRLCAKLSKYFRHPCCFSIRGGSFTVPSHGKFQRGKRSRVLRELVQPRGQDTGGAASLGHTSCHDDTAARRRVSLRHFLADKQQRNHDGELWGRKGTGADPSRANRSDSGCPARLPRA